MVSSSCPTRISALIVAVKDPASSTPSRLTTANPGNVKEIVYVPGRRSITRYRPLLSVVTDRTFSIRAGLDASTVTPGRTAPDVSLTTPAMVPLWSVWADPTAARPVMVATSKIATRTVCSFISAPKENDPGRSAHTSSGVAQETPVRLVALVELKPIPQTSEERLERGSVRVWNLEGREDTAEVGAMVAI